jgi:hypothetical protein
MYCVVDTETATLPYADEIAQGDPERKKKIAIAKPLVYDIGWTICDRAGVIHDRKQFLIAETFSVPAVFNTAYYAEKRPMYEQQIAAGSRKIVSIYTARRHIHELCKKYDVKAIIAHNARFDYKSTNGTLRYVTKSKMRYFLPYGIPVWDTLKMAQDTICKQKTYIRWCAENGYLQKNGKVRATAEILYRYITCDNDFIEDHTGLEDVLIEKEIFSKCMAQHKSMRKALWA